MLKQISLNEVIIPIQQNRKREFEIFDNKQTALPNMDTIEDIIEKNIQIQYALIPFYENRAEKRSPVYQNIIGLNPARSKISQLNSLSVIFERCGLYKSGEDIAGIQISKPVDGAVPAFQNLLEKQKLDKWLTLFVASEDVQDVKAHAYFEYISDKNFSEDIYALSNEL